MKINTQTNTTRTNESLNYTPDREAQFKEVLAKAKNGLLATAQTAAGFSGNPLISLASVASNGSNNSSLSADTQMQKTLQEQNQKFNMDFLKLQNDLQTENRKFTTLSNISKARHDTSKAAINNIRV